MRSDSFASSWESNRHNSTLVACSENRAKLTPAPSQVAPRGYGRPGQTRMGVTPSERMGHRPESRYAHARAGVEKEQLACRKTEGPPCPCGRTAPRPSSTGVLEAP